MVLRLPAVPSSVPLSRGAVLRWCDRVTARCDVDVALAVTEAVSNVVRHAYPGGGGELEVCADVRSEEVRVGVRDWGVGFQAHSPNAGLGIGLRIIEAVATKVVMKDCEPGTLVSMRFWDTRSPADQAAATP